MKLLAIDSSRRTIALGLCDGDAEHEVRLSSDQRQETALAPAVRELLANHGLRPADLDGVVVGIGPGSFTGLRIGIAFGTLLARGLNRPAVGVSGFETLVAGVDAEGPVLVLEDDHPRGVYGGLFERSKDGTIQELAPITHEEVEAWIARAPKGAIAVGSAIDRHRELLFQADLKPEDEVELSGIRLARLGEQRLRKGAPEDWSVAPLYVQPLRLRPSASGKEPGASAS